MRLVLKFVARCCPLGHPDYRTEVRAGERLRKEVYGRGALLLLPAVTGFDSSGQLTPRPPSCPEPSARVAPGDALFTFLKASGNALPFLDQFCLVPLVSFEFLRLTLGLFRTDKVL